MNNYNVIIVPMPPTTPEVEQLINASIPLTMKLEGMSTFSTPSGLMLMLIFK